MTYCQKMWRIISGGIMGSLVFSVSFTLAMPAGGQHWVNVDRSHTPGFFLVDDDQQQDELSNERGPQRGKKGDQGKGRGKRAKGNGKAGNHEKMSPEMQSLLRRQQQEREELRARHKQELEAFKGNRKEDRGEDDHDDKKGSHDGKEKFKKEKKGKKHKEKDGKRNGERHRDHRDQTQEAAPSDLEPTLQEVVPPGPEQQTP